MIGPRIHGGRPPLPAGLLAAGVLLALGALAVALPSLAAAREDGKARFIIRAPGATIGREMYESAPGPGPGERTVEARAWADFPMGGRFRLRQQLTFDVLGRVRSYDVEIDSPAGPMRAGAAWSAGVCTLRFTGRDSTGSQAVACPSEAAIADPFFANHYQWLLDRLFAGGMSAPLPDSVFLVCPQSLEAQRAAITEIQGEVGFFEGRAVTVRRLEIAQPKRHAQIWFDEKDGALYRVRLLTHFMDIVREGFRPSNADTTLPARVLDPCPPGARPAGTLRARATSYAPPGDARAVAVLLPDGGPPEAPADSAARFLRDLARSLAGRGIASYVLDPGGGGGGGDAALIRGWVKPALALIDTLRAAGAPDGRIFLVGHGLGAVAAERIAARDSVALGGLVLLAPPVRPAREWFAKRTADCLGRAPATEDMGWTPADWIDMDTFDPRSGLLRSGRPVLVLSAEADCEIDARRGRSTFDRILATSRRPEAESRLLPGVNHLFRPEGSTAGSAPSSLAREIAFWIEAVQPFAR